ncbi:hypothetical protein CRE_10001 [Caenorhabditis remanei]|uniref:Uncharacterized protein n=1 Tax=Caenorhabditis remanei TaxID=31234 RepID=E3M6R0_CAERE|nr:hypothetical protein CRE_10001 [Caenorhabditis remanei]
MHSQPSGSRPNHRHPRAYRWPLAPMIQINATVCVLNGAYTARVIVDSTPYEFDDPALAPLLHFTVLDGHLRPSGAEPRASDFGPNAHIPGTLRIFSASTHAWTRRHAPLPNLRCGCNPHYNNASWSHTISRQRLTDPSTLSLSAHTVKDLASCAIHITFWNRLQSPTLSHPAAHTIQPVASCPINVTLHN